jgi:hypothetical protein
MTRLHFTPNEPLKLRLADPRGDSERFDFSLQMGLYRTIDGKEVLLPRQAVELLNELDPNPGEEIGICRKKGSKGDEWTVWLTASSEQARANEETALESLEAPTDTESLLKASVEQVEARKRGRKPVPIRKDPAPAKGPLQPRLFDRRGTGTDGPIPALAPQLAPRPAIAAKTPYGRMLRHIVRTVEAVLKAEGVQLGDGPKQDLYSTVYIDAAKRSGVEYDFREAE